MLVLIRHLWQLKTVVFLHWCLIQAGLFQRNGEKFAIANNNGKFTLKCYKGMVARAISYI